MDIHIYMHGCTFLKSSKGYIKKLLVVCISVDLERQLENSEMCTFTLYISITRHLYHVYILLL